MSDLSQIGGKMPGNELLAPSNGGHETDRKMRREDGDLDDLDHDEIDLEMAELEVEAEQARLLLEIQQRERHDGRDVRRQALDEKRREVEALKQQLQSTNTSHSPASIKPSKQLDFNTPYTRSMPDNYSRATMPPAKNRRRQTMSVLDQVDDEEADIMIRVPMPPKFDGSGLCSSSNDPAESVQVRLAHALDDIVDYIDFMADFKNVSLSPRQFVKLACRFLTGTAAGVYKNLQLIAKQEADRLGHAAPALVLWPDVRSALEARFGKPQPGHQLIRRMLKLAQRSGETVEAYTVRFDSLHMELTRQGLASRDLTVALFIEGLSPAIRDKVDEVVNSIDYFERENIGPHEARKAVTALQLIAAARESHLATSKGQQPSGASQPRPTQQAPSGQQQSAQAPKPKNAQPKQPNNVPDALYSERIAAGLCGKCNSASHTARECNNQRNTLPVPRRNGARANKMEASESGDDAADGTDSKK